MPVETKGFDLKTWDGFSELPKRELDYLLDTTALNKKLADSKDSPYRWRVGSYQVGREWIGNLLEKATKTAIKIWLAAMSKQGWELASKIQVFGPFPAHDLLTNLIILDKKEMRLRAIFKTKPKPIRIELPPSSVRVDPEQKATLAEVMRGEGINPISRQLRPIR